MSLEQFKAAWLKTGQCEKGYVNDQNDSGGETCYGITLAVARAHGYTGPMNKLPIEVATDIAKSAYWDVMLLDEIASLSVLVANKLFDMGILCGRPTATMYFQRSLNVFNRSDSDKPLYDEVKEDFNLGKMTVYAASLLAKARGKDWEKVMFRALDCQEGTHMIDITRAAAKDEKFVFGWFLNRVGV